LQSPRTKKEKIWSAAKEGKEYQLQRCLIDATAEDFKFEQMHEVGNLSYIAEAYFVLVGYDFCPAICCASRMGRRTPRSA
jgi:hypothetical protein